MQASGHIVSATYKAETADMFAGLFSPKSPLPHLSTLSPIPAFDDDLAWSVVTPAGFLGSPKLQFPPEDLGLGWFSAVPDLEDRSPDTSPHCSEDESDAKSLAGGKTAKESRKRKLAPTKQKVEIPACDVNCLAVLAEDADESKQRAFPAIEHMARYAAKLGQGDAITCLVEAFTEGKRHGRPLPMSCEELLQRATAEVAASRKRQRVKGSAVAAMKSEPAANGQSSFACSDCPKVYSTAEGLRLHIRNHHEVDKRWICHAASCCTERAFVRQADLRMHIIRVHSPVRPFPCRVPGCDKAFSANNELRRHIATLHMPLAERLYAEGKGMAAEEAGAVTPAPPSGAACARCV